MPQLPSGKKVGISPDLVREMVENPFYHLINIGQIKNIEGLYPFLNITEFVQSNGDDAPEIKLTEESKNIDEVSGLKAVETDITVADVLGKNTDWSDEDIDAFAKWLGSKDMQGVYQIIFETIEKTKSGICDHIDTLAFTDIDPNQDESERFRRAGAYVDAVSRLVRKKNKPDG